VSKLERDAPEVRVVLSEPVDYETFAEGLRDAKLFVSPLGCAPCWSCMLGAESWVLTALSDFAVRCSRDSTAMHILHCFRSIGPIVALGLLTLNPPAFFSNAARRRRAARTMRRSSAAQC